MFANTQMGGINVGFPDVCLTPAPPAPAPDPGAVPQHRRRADGRARGVQGAVHVRTGAQHGDDHPAVERRQRGVSPSGVASGTVMGPNRHLTGCLHRARLRHAGDAADQRRAPELDELPGGARRAEPGEGAALGAVRARTS